MLARDTATGHFRILSDTDLKKAASAPPADGPKRSGVTTGAPLTETTRKKAEELSLVSTQILRKVVKPDGKSEVEKLEAGQQERQVRGLQPLRQQLGSGAHQKGSHPDFDRS